MLHSLGLCLENWKGHQRHLFKINYAYEDVEELQRVHNFKLQITVAEYPLYL